MLIYAESNPNVVFFGLFTATAAASDRLFHVSAGAGLQPAAGRLHCVHVQSLVRVRQGDAGGVRSTQTGHLCGMLAQTMASNYQIESNQHTRHGFRFTGSTRFPAQHVVPLLLAD